MNKIQPTQSDARIDACQPKTDITLTIRTGIKAEEISFLPPPEYLKKSDNTFSSHVGAKGSSIFDDNATGANGPLVINMHFP